jgi:hypothetical protein
MENKILNCNNNLNIQKNLNLNKKEDNDLIENKSN